MSSLADLGEASEDGFEGSKSIHPPRHHYRDTSVRITKASRLAHLMKPGAQHVDFFALSDPRPQELSTQQLGGGKHRCRLIANPAQSPPVLQSKARDDERDPDEMRYPARDAHHAGVQRVQKLDVARGHLVRELPGCSRSEHTPTELSIWNHIDRRAGQSCGVEIPRADKRHFDKFIH